jgi:hypothetical protein
MDRHDIPGSSGPAAPTRYNRRLVEQDVFGYKRVLVSGDQNPSKYVKQSKPRDRPHRPRLVDIVISGKNSVAIGREVGENVVEEEGGLPLQGNIITDDAVLPLETESSSSHNAEDLEPSHTDCSESEQVTTEKAYGDVTQANEGNEGGLEDSNASIHEERQEVEGNDSMEESIQSDVEGSDTDESIEGDSGNSDIDETVQYDAEDKDVDEYGSVHSENYEFLYDGCPIREDQSVILISLYASWHHLSDVAVMDLLQLISLHCPFPNNCTKSHFRYKRIRNKTFSGQPTKEKKLVCGSCGHETGSNVCTNEECNKYQKTAFKPCQQITIPIAPQLQRLVSAFWDQLP